VKIHNLFIRQTAIDYELPLVH